MRLLFSIALAGFMAAAVTQAAPLFFDNFDNSFPGEPALIGSIWPRWPQANGNLNTSDNHNHTPGGTVSEKSDPTYHNAFANYHDFGPAAVGVIATAWLFEDNNQVGDAAHPINISIGLYGDSGSPTDNTDYLLLGLNPAYAGYNTYGYKSLTEGIGNAAVTRAAALAGSVDHSGWVKLTIKAGSLASGGHVGFYINDVLVGTTLRTPGVSLRYFLMGTPGIALQTANYEFFWIDDVSITAIPEITGISVANNQASINFISATQDDPSTFTLVSSTNVSGAYSPADGASITGGNGSYQATVPTGGDVRFYRIQR